jgi:hypothetical protein
MSRSKPIYVEAFIQAPIEALWKHTQTPELHQQWDLRFSEITYIPKSSETEPQRFLYQTNIGFGLSVAGEGETVGTKEKNGVLTSSLKFSSANPISLIREGAGFWRYVPTEGGIRFLTRYDYQTRFGTIGGWLDRLIFRPLMGWATAWSFDCLRLWLERGIPPQLSLRRAAIEIVSALSLCLIWLYQGLVPKLLVPDSGEMDILQGAAFLHGFERPILTLMGLGEIAFGLLFVMLRGTKRKVLYKTNILVLFLLGLGAAVQPAAYVAPFNPISLSLAMIALSLTGLLNSSQLPSAGKCLRTEPGTETSTETSTEPDTERLIRGRKK